MHYYLAASHNHDEIVKELLKFYPNAALVDKKNQTAYLSGIKVKTQVLLFFLKTLFLAITSQSDASAQLIQNYFEKLKTMLFES